MSSSRNTPDSGRGALAPSAAGGGREYAAEAERAARAEPRASGANAPAHQHEWYAPADLDASATVRLLLPGGEASGFLMLDHKKGTRSWRVLRDNGAADVLPFEPFAWRPLPGQPWPHRLPPPITLSRAGRFVDVRPRKLAAMQRQAEQSRETMEALEREHGSLEEASGAQARYGSLSGSGVQARYARDGASLVADKDQWWIDETAVTYSPAGEISLFEAEGRVARAILTDGLKAIERPAAFAGVAAGLASMVAETMTSADAERRPRFEPTSRDLADYLTAMGWFARIAPLEMRPTWAGNDWLSGAQKVLVWRALVPPMSWRQIAKRAGGSQEGWRKTWGGALHAVHRVANGLEPLRHVKVADQLAALRERNMAWKRKHHEPIEILENALQVASSPQRDWRRFRVMLDGVTYFAMRREGGDEWLIEDLWGNSVHAKGSAGLRVIRACDAVAVFESECV